MHLPMRGIHIFEKPYYREISPMRGGPMSGPPVSDNGCSRDAFLLTLTYCTASGGILWQSRILTNCMAQKAQSS